MNTSDPSSESLDSTEDVISPIASHPINTKPAWSPTAIAWVCLLFTLLPAGIMYALNFERLGQPTRMKRAFYFVLGGALIYYALAVRLAWKVDFGSGITELNFRAWSAIVNIILAWIFYLGQQRLFVQHIRQGGKKASLIVPLALSVLWGLTFWGAYTAVALTVESRQAREFDQAVVLMNKGRNKEAEAIFKSYKTQNPVDTTAYWNLSLIYARTGRVSLAKRELTDLLRLEPSNQDAREFLQELEDTRAE